MPILALDLLKKPDLLKQAPVYVVMGEDLFLRTTAMQLIEDNVFHDDPEKMGLTKKSGDSASLADVLDELSTPSFFAPKRMVALDPADSFISKNRESIEKYISKPCTSSILVLACKVFPTNTKLYKIIDSQNGTGMIIDARPPKPAELVNWVISRAVTHQAKIERDAAQLLVDLVGTETGLIDQELEKLSIATHDGQKSIIRHQDVDLYVHSGKTDSVWSMIEKACTGQQVQALNELDSLLSAGESPVGLLAAMSVNLTKVYHAGMLIIQRQERDLALREAGVPSFPKAMESAKAQLKHLGPARVAQLPSMLLQADLDQKGWSELSARLTMERLIIQLAMPRKD